MLVGLSASAIGRIENVTEPVTLNSLAMLLLSIGGKIELQIKTSPLENKESHVK